MSIDAVTIPKWGMTMTEGVVADWLVAEGDEVSRGQEIIEVESTKTTNSVESAASGILRRIVVQVGDTAPVGALVGVIADASVSDADIDAFIASFASADDSAAEEDLNAPSVKAVDIGDGRVVNVLTMGLETDESVVLVHGFGGDLSTWLFNQDTLAQGHRVVAVDLPGHGASTPIQGNNVFDDLVGAVERVLESVAPGRMHIVAHSFGGAVAAALAARQSGRVASLSLIAPVGLSKQINKSFLDDFISAERRRPLKEVLERLLADPSKISNDMIEGTLRFKRLEGVPEALSAIRDTIVDESGQQRHWIAGTVADFKGPVALIWGENDQIVPLPSESQVPSQVKLNVIRGVGHMPQMEAASEVNSLVLENISRAK
ncbi:acetoin dehydrogenase dihydrolipoyllysine-residue acetyltransferase subunit [Pseudomonas sp. Teo4]|uniref:acetoin dehydrogenase dihydrolipoyllysine-residue acetyltransferase subunit n=1 Tax=Pseudomonas sp. Teo4 TaxID=3064528 RepID=UPI002AB93433|nr:acetoin dehydrogenase dihydrolipoyllysine-residue acetyltransferase subunit [Pseudomonas sp. Teo4]MDZ3992609.1 Dihydrolipoyllysine-residue acetyltransferase component of acetoin cleaving system [Pseudomonas sp. Teo4]